jgi:GT2 family glycosyltransferase
MNSVFVSIIIPLKQFNDYIREAIVHYERLEYKNFELIILPDKEEKETLSDKLDIKVIPTGPVGPAEKRDLGAKIARGKILAFTDDDAYPDKDWLKNAVELLLSSNDIGAVGGPGITPKEDNFWQRISGNVYSSLWMSGGYRKRYLSVGKIHEDYDLPSVNLIVKKEVFEAAGGFDSTYYPGEDTKFCLAVKNLGYKILYNPNIIVYHHRRNLFSFHFKQISNYALHRGFFAKKYPETSLKIAYIIPSIFLIGLFFGLIFCLFLPVLWLVYIFVVAIYFILGLIFSYGNNFLEKFITFFAIFLSHLTYGFYFIIGLIKKELKR